MRFNDYMTVFRKVFSQWAYVVLSFLVALLFYTFNVFATNKTQLGTFFSDLGFVGTMKILFALLWGFVHTIKPDGFVTVIVISVLLGILVSLITYKTRLGIALQEKRVGIWGGIGAFLAALVPGCAACGVGLISFLGIGVGVLAFLPFNGLEIALLSIAILVWTILYTAQHMYTCRIRAARERSMAMKKHAEREVDTAKEKTRGKNTRSVK